MLVYGDRSAERDPRKMIADLRAALAALPGVRAGIERHAALVDAFIEASELAQGLADAAFWRVGCDAPSPEQDVSMALLMTLAAAVNASWRSGFIDTAAPFAPDLDTLAALPLPERVAVKQAEGYAFYALYPEAYAKAAQALAPAPDIKVIGLRSVGAGLSAIVAAALGAGAPVTVRPGGHPFARELSLSPALQTTLLNDPGARYAIVDEGPGLSGSSLNSVADWLEDRGVSAERIIFFPGHGGDLGAQASDRHRARWSQASRRIERFEALALDAPNRAHTLACWAEELIGPATAPLRDISGGAWRALRYAAEADWPAVDTFQERRKYLMTTERGTWLLKFSGLGRAGLRKLERARALADAGFIAPVAGLRHGFLVQRWMEEGGRLDRPGLDRERLIRHLGRYLGFRARNFPSAAGDGADLATLVEMALVNTREALGEDAARRLQARLPDLDTLQAQARPVEVDGRLQGFKWLVRPDGSVLKADALDHCEAHDLIGAQDVAWDVAGAAVEFGLDAGEREKLAALVERHGGSFVDSGRLAAYVACYLPFQLGARAMAADAHQGSPLERERLVKARDLYRAALAAHLA